MNRTGSKRPLTFLYSMLFAAIIPGSVVTAETSQPFRVYYMGNSVTDTIRYKPLVELAATRGVKLDWGRHMIPGAPLEWLYTHENDGFRERPYGGWREALNNFAWDAVSFQPFDRSFHGTNTAGQAVGDLDLITELSRMAAGKNPEVRILVYARWPRMRSGGKPFSFDKNAYDPAKPGNGYDLAKLDQWAQCWESGYDPATRKGSNESREYFEKLHAAVVENTKFLKKSAELVRVGHAMAALDAKMRAGEVPGYSTVWQLYKDGIHLNETGSYLVGCVYFANLFHQDPTGLPTSPYGNVDAKLAPLIQKLAWETTKATKESK